MESTYYLATSSSDDIYNSENCICRKCKNYEADPRYMYCKDCFLKSGYSVYNKNYHSSSLDDGLMDEARIRISSDKMILNKTLSKKSKSSIIYASKIF